MENEMMSLPMVALRGMTVLPEQVVHFDVSREKSLQAVERAMREEQKIFLTAQKDVDTDDPGIGDVYRVGCVASIKQIVKVHGNVRRILVAGEKRAEIEYLQDTPFLHADIRVIPDKESEDAKEIFGNDLKIGRAHV